MSALPPKADICRVGCHVRFVPIADINGYSITSSASNCIELGTLKPSALAVFRLMTSSYLLICKYGQVGRRSAGFAPFKILSTYAAALATRQRASVPQYQINATPTMTAAISSADCAVEFTQITECEINIEVN